MIWLLTALLATSPCMKRLGTVRARLSAANRSPQTVMPVRGVTVPHVATAKPLLDRGDVVVLADDLLLVNGVPSQEDTLEARLRAGSVVYLQADAGASLATHARVVDRLRRRHDLRLVVQTPPQKSAPFVFAETPLWAKERIAAGRVEKGIDAANMGCDALTPALASEQTVRAKRVVAALAQCSCRGVDVDAIEALVAATLVTETTLGWVKIAPAARLDGATVASLAASLVSERPAAVSSR